MGLNFNLLSYEERRDRVDERARKFLRLHLEEDARESLLMDWHRGGYISGWEEHDMVVNRFRYLLTSKAKG